MSSCRPSTTTSCRSRRCVFSLRGDVAPLTRAWRQDDENDMLDMAFGLTDTSRLGCQVHLTRELDGITCTLPSATRNMFVDGMRPLLIRLP